MVTSRTTGDDLIEDQDTQSADITDDTVTSDIMAPPRRPARKPAPAKPAPATPASGDDASDGKAGGDVTVNGTPAAEEPARPAPVDATMVDGIPALPADTIGSSRGKPKEPAGSTRLTGSEPSAGNSGTSDSSVFSFGPPPSAPAQPAVEDPIIAYPAESAVKPAGEAPVATTATGSALSGSSDSASAPTRSSDIFSSAPAAAASSVPPAAFAWEMPDPPADSPSSPARAFLRSGLTAKDSAPAKPGSGPAPSAASTTSAPPAPAPAGKPAAGKGPTRGPVTLGPSRGGTAKAGAAAKGQKKAPSKRSARQAHLTISRIEPWSVMKFSFVVSLVAFVILFVAVSVLYGALSGLGVFDSIQHLVNSVTSSQNSTGVNAKAWFSASRILGYTALLGSLNIVLITAMSTIGSVVYNLTSRLVGGVEVTLRETE
jgi:hypothetical protein